MRRDPSMRRSEGESLARIRAAHHRRVQHRRRPLRVRPRPDPAPQPRQGRPGRTKTRLVLDPVRAPVVTQIFTWRTENRLGVTTITNRFNADPGRCPSPKPGGWTTSAVYALLGNPKYTGHMVYGRRRSQAGQTPPLRAPRPMGLVPRTRPPRHHHPAGLGHRPDRRRRPRQRPR